MRDQLFNYSTEKINIYYKNSKKSNFLLITIIRILYYNSIYYIFIIIYQLTEIQQDLNLFELWIDMKIKVILLFVCIFFSFVGCIRLAKSPKTTLEKANSTLPKSLNLWKTDNCTNPYLSSFTKYDLIILNDVGDDYENEHKIKNALKKIQDDSFNLTDFYQYLLFKIENKDLIGSYIYLTYKNYTFNIKKSSSFLSEVLKEQGSIDIISIMKYFISREPLGEDAKIKNNRIVMQTPFRFSQRDQTIWNDIGYNTPDKDYYKIGSTQTSWKGMVYVDPIKHYYGFTYRLSKEESLLNTFNCWGFAIGIPQFLLPLQQITPTLIRFQVGLNRGELANMINLYGEFFKNHPALKTILNYDQKQ